jgi:hypothetical protein
MEEGYEKQPTLAQSRTTSRPGARPTPHRALSTLENCVAWSRAG